MQLINKIRKEVPTISVVGLLALAIVFGWVRYGYGLLLPNFREDFNLSASMLGVISSLSFLSFLVGAWLVMFLVSAYGPRRFILSGIFAGSLGMLIAALTNNSFIFAVGVIIAGLSPGLCWSSFSDSVSQHIKKSLQKRSLAVISTGSSLGLVMISISYLLLQGNWRIVWGGGGLVGFVIFLLALKAIPPGTIKNSSKEKGKEKISSFVTKYSIPLFIASIAFGMTEATYWTYAADFVEQTFKIQSANAIFFLIAGIGGLAGLWAGDLINFLGFKKSIFLTVFIYSISMFILFVSQSWLMICFSGFLFGATFMLYAAYLPIWSAEVFPETPAKGFSICIIILNVGTIIGPALFGGVLALVEYKWMFLMLSLIACLKIFLTPANKNE
jgi:predicted MFS family arabinose efflux permease